MRAPRSGAAMPRAEPSTAGAGEGDCCSPLPLGSRSSGSANGAVGGAWLTSAAPRPCCGMGLGSSSPWPAWRSLKGAAGGNASTELRLGDNCGDRGGGSESMEKGKEQVQRRCRRGDGPGRDDAERPAEDRGRSRRTSSQNWLIKSASGFNWLKGFWHRCRARSQGPGYCDVPSGMSRRTKGAKPAPMAKQAHPANPLGPAASPKPAGPA